MTYILWTIGILAASIIVFVAGMVLGIHILLKAALGNTKDKDGNARFPFLNPR